MTVETEVAALTTSVDALTSAVNVKKATLDASVSSAASSVTSALAHKDATNTLKTETTAIKDAAVTASSSAATAAASAYQDLASVSQQKAITATDVFVYDTSKDADGGAWRNRTQGTSWYNEALNTSTRGATKKFPAVAVIVAEVGKVTVYDADDPSMPMWMEFSTSSSGGNWDGDITTSTFDLLVTGSTNTVTMKDGLLIAGGASALVTVSFISERSVYRGSTTNTDGVYSGTLAERNDNKGHSVEEDLGIIVNATVNDIAVTVLPNAPIDPDTGLPVPTIAVATQGGVSVIKDDGSVVDITGQPQAITQIEFAKDNRIITQRGYGSELFILDIPESDRSYLIDYSQNDLQYYPSTNASATTTRIFTGSFTGLADTGEDIKISSVAGLCHLHTANNVDNSLVAYTTSDYSTGWMVGDIKLATLMDTTAETVSAPELVTNGEFSSLGSNLITNGEFPNDANGWTLNGSDWEWDNSGRIERVAGTTNSATTQNINIEDGKTYRVRYDVVHTSGNTQSNCFIDTGTGNITIGTLFGSGSVDTFFTATATTTMQFRIYGINDWRGFIDNVRVEEVTGWLEANGTTDNGTPSVAFDNTKVTLNGYAYPSHATVKQGITTEVGKTYRISFNCLVDNQAFVIAMNSSHASIGTHSINTGVQSVEFTATTTTSFVVLRSQSATGAASEFDDISVTEVVADRSHNSNGLNIVGNVTKSAVATGAELVGYGTTGASNYLTQPYNADYNFGYGDFCIMGWAKHVGGDQTLFYRGTGNGFHETGGLYLWINNHKLKFRAGGNRQFEVDAPISPMNSGQWHHYVVCRRDGVVYAYQDGVLFYSQNISDSNIDSSTHTTKISSAYYTNNNVSNLLALLRISATAPTAEQIAKIYRDEKPLFQGGAQCTIYGEQKYLQAMAFDETTKLIHVGTTAATGVRGQSIFDGLERVDYKHNQNVAVALSAANGLVVEE